MRSIVFIHDEEGVDVPESPVSIDSHCEETIAADNQLRKTVRMLDGCSHVRLSDPAFPHPEQCVRDETKAHTFFSVVRHLSLYLNRSGIDNRAETVYGAPVMAWLP